MEEAHELIRVLMSAKKVRSTTLAEELGISRQGLYKFLNGETNLSHDKFLTILNYFGLDVVSLAKQALLNMKPTPDVSEISSDLGLLLSYVDEFQRNYQINYLVTVCKNELAKRPDPKVEISINRVSEHYLRDGR